MSELSARAEEILGAIYAMREDGSDTRALALEIVQTLTLREMALIIVWRDGCRGMEPEHGSLTVTFAGETISSEFTRKSRQTLARHKTRGSR